jgi:two-component system phosphate regulon sensor histidine kinase PhoR
MPSLDSWLQITIRTPFLLLLLLLLTGVIAAGVVAYWRLLTRIKKLSDETQDLQVQLVGRAEQEAQWASAREAYRHFIYNLSHEVSNPLQSIQTNLDNMASCSADETGRWRQYHQIITTEVRRLADLTENLRLLSHLEAPGAPTVREPVNLKGVVEDVIMALFETAEARGVRLRYVGPERPARVLGDRDRLRQVVLNLVDNGIKYSRAEGGEVIISVQEEQDRLCVRVSDEGVGISEKDLPHIFDTAYRAPDARRFRRQGSGLGLAIVKQIVERHGGEIRVRSQLGEGTTFSFDLPLYAPS